jgi:hypothetical protein
LADRVKRKRLQVNFVFLGSLFLQVIAIDILGFPYILEIDNEHLKESARPLQDIKSSTSIFNQQAFENQLTK